MQNGIVDSFTHVPAMHGRHFARCFCRYSGNIASDISMHNKRADSSTLTMDIEFWEQILFLLRDLLPNMNLIQDSIDLASVKNH